MKTPIQELIEEIKSLKSSKLYESSFKLLDNCIHLCYAKLGTEEQVIKDSWKDGCYNEKQGHPKNAEEYFEKTFKQ